MSINSRAKGARGENQICKVLDEWWGVADGTFVRSPGSGGFATRNTAHQWAAGDIIVAVDDFPFCVEVKYRQNWELEQMLTAPKCPLFTYWEQTKNSTAKGSFSLLLFRKNFKPWFYMMKIHPKHTEYQKDFVKSSPMRVIDRQGEAAYIGPMNRLLAEPKEPWQR